MQYLQSAPFTVGLGTKKYSEGWDRIFGAKKQEAEVVEPMPDTERSQALTETPAKKEPSQ
jgi:hypothetical protein